MRSDTPTTIRDRAQVYHRRDEIEWRRARLGSNALSHDEETIVLAARIILELSDEIGRLKKEAQIRETKSPRTKPPVPIRLDISH